MLLAILLINIVNSIFDNSNSLINTLCRSTSLHHDIGLYIIARYIGEKFKFGNVTVLGFGGFIKNVKSFYQTPECVIPPLTATAAATPRVLVFCQPVLWCTLQ